MIEIYITVLASIFVIHVLFTSCYLLTGRKFKKLTRDNTFILTRFFRYKNHNWKIFWLSVLWLLVYFFEYIKNYVLGVL